MLYNLWRALQRAPPEEVSLGLRRLLVRHRPGPQGCTRARHLVRDIDEAKHIAICYQFAESVRRVFSQATLASDALRAHEQYDANRSARIYSLTIKRNLFSSSTLHFRVDAADRDVWWQLRDAPATWEYAGRGWFVVPVLTVPDFNAYLRQKVLDLIGTLQEDETTGAVLRHRGSRF